VRYTALSTGFLIFLSIASISYADDFVPEGETDVTFSANVLTLDGDDTGGDIDLQFGNTLGETLQWDSVNARFSLSDSLDLQSQELINIRIENLVSAPICDAGKLGQIYYNTSDKLTYSCDGAGIWNPFENALNATIEFPVVQARRTTSFTLPTTYGDVDLDTTDLENDVSTLDHDDTLRDRIDIGATAMYQIIYGYTAGGSATGTHEARARVRVNDTSVLPGSESVNKNYQGEFSTTSASFLANLSAGDFISLQLQRDATVDVTQDEIYFSIIKLEGIKGDPGVPGADGAPGSVGLGTNENVFTLDQDDSGGDVTLQFGTTLAEFIRWDDTNSRFLLSADLDLASAQLINTRFENLPSAPSCDALSTGRVYYDTVLSKPLVCDGTDWVELGSGGGSSTPQPLATALYRDSSSTNINSAATDNIVPWNIEDFEDSTFLHDTVTNNSRVAVTKTAKYLVSGSVNIVSTVQRYNGILKFRINGTTTLPVTFQPGYIRSASGQNETSLTFSTILDLNAGDYFEVLIDRESATGVATMIPNSSSLSVVQLVASGSAGSSTPFVESVSPPVIGTNSTFDITITGTGFIPDSTVSIPGFPGTINTTTVVSPTQIDLNITTVAVQNSYDIVIDNNGTDNTTWPGNGIDSLEVLQIVGTGAAGTYTESFETNFGSWVSSGLAAAWTRNNGGTGSAGTGPNGASAGATYIYTETSNPNFPNVQFGIQTTDFAHAESISFDYHMVGADIGVLELQTFYDGVWTTRFTLSGQQQGAQGDAYLNQFIDLSPFPVEGLRFFYTSGANFAGDTALDNIVIISS